MNIIELTKTGSAKICISKLSDEMAQFTKENFDRMFNLHPEERGRVLMKNNEVESSRWHQSYLNTPKFNKEIHGFGSYMYSGHNPVINELPDDFKKVFDYFNNLESTGPDKYNQVIVNWYLNGKDFIESHSDCQLDMVPDAPIVIISIQGIVNENLNRKLVIKPRNDYRKKLGDFVHEKYEILMPHGTVIEMCGDMQEKFTHKIPKEPLESKFPPRISITLRKFKI